MKTLGKIAITGISSFIGSNIAIDLAKKGYQIIGGISKNINTYDYPRNLRLGICKKYGTNFCELNLKDKDNIINFIRTNKPHYLIHNAAWVKDANKLDFNLNESLKVNIIPLRTLYEELTRCSAKGIIITGTNAEYGDKNGSCSESDLCMPTTPYGLSKLSETITAYQLFNEFNLPTRVARVFNPIGGLDNPKKLLPSIISSVNINKSFKLSNCSQKRDFIYIGDLVNGYQKLIEELKEGFEIFNLCSGFPLSVRELLELILKKMDKDQSLLNYGALAMRPGEPEISFGNNTKAINLLGWQPDHINKKIDLIINEILKNNP